MLSALYRPLGHAAARRARSKLAKRACRARSLRQRAARERREHPLATFARRRASRESDEKPRLAAPLDVSRGYQCSATSRREPEPEPGTSIRTLKVRGSPRVLSATRCETIIGPSATVCWRGRSSFRFHSVCSLTVSLYDITKLRCLDFVSAIYAISISAAKLLSHDRFLRFFLHPNRQSEK